MTRQVDSKNQIWFEKQEQVTTIGFTQTFLNSLDQCWHILPANTEKFREKSPLLTVETNDALVSILSPVSGSFLEFTAKAQNFPNKLTEGDVIIKLSDRAPVRPDRDRVVLNVAAQHAAAGGFARWGNAEAAPQVGAEPQRQPRNAFERDRERRQFIDMLARQAQDMQREVRPMIDEDNE
jgi:glycine cleavage system H lipoate-binding protein